MILHSMPSSGNSYKVRLLLALLGRTDVATVDVEYDSASLAAAHAGGRLPFGKAPVLELPDGTLLPESNAILYWLAEGTDWLPKDPADRARVLAWMFWEQNQHEGVIAVRAALRTYPHRRAEATPARLADLLARGHGLLQIMEDHLAARDWLVGAAPTVADVCLYGYTHSADTLGGFDMARFPGVRAWLDRVAALPGHVPLA